MQFHCHSDGGVKGTYIFALPGRSAMYDSGGSMQVGFCVNVASLELCSSWLNSHRIWHELWPLELYVALAKHIYIALSSVLRKFIPSIIVPVTWISDPSYSMYSSHVNIFFSSIIMVVVLIMTMMMIINPLPTSHLSFTDEALWRNGLCPCLQLYNHPAGWFSGIGLLEVSVALFTPSSFWKLSSSLLLWWHISLVFLPVLCSPLRLLQELFSLNQVLASHLELHPLALWPLVQSLSDSLVSGQKASSKTCSLPWFHSFFIPILKFHFNLLNLLPSTLMSSSENLDPYMIPSPTTKRWNSEHIVSFQK